MQVCTRLIKADMQKETTSMQARKALPKPKEKNQELRRSYSECSNHNLKFLPVTNKSDAAQSCTTGASSQVETVRCACCTVSEDCTAAYIRRIRTVYCGDWVCGLCSEAVSERMRRDPAAAGVEEALRSHMAMCKDFNATTRLNPKLSLAGSMRDIARRSFHRRTSCQDHLRGGAANTMTRTLSCQPEFFT